VIYCYFGVPGSRKSYEVVRYQVLGALRMGRQVVTNLPINLDALAEDFPDYVDLVKIIPNVDEFGAHRQAFTSMIDFITDWKHQICGMGPLTCIDECHFCFTLSEAGAEEKTFLREVSRWFSVHRHENVNVVLVTQHYGKIFKDIRDLVEVWVGLRNNRNLGPGGT
jgi:zona occludens toxin